MRNNADYLLAVEKAVEKIGKSNGTKPPAANDPTTQAAQEYALAVMVKQIATARYDTAKKDLSLLCPGTDVIAHTSSFVDVTRTVRDGARTLNAEKVMAMLVKRFGMTIDDARDAVDSCRVQGAGSVMFNATLKQ